MDVCFTPLHTRGLQEKMSEKRHRTRITAYLSITIIGIVLIFSCEYLGFFEGINTYLYDTCMRMRGVRNPSDRILIASVDERTLDALGRWLASHVPAKRNTVRFLLPADGEKGIYQDGELLFCSRCSYLTSIAWRDDSKYRGLKEEFDKPLRDALKKRFDRFAVLRRWNYQQPDQCIFDVERVTAQGGEIPTAVEKSLVEDLFDPAEFQSLVLERAKESCLVGDLLDELTEPPPPDTKIGVGRTQTSRRARISRWVRQRMLVALGPARIRPHLPLTVRSPMRHSL